jgi:hypothetical protein
MRRGVREVRPSVRRVGFCQHAKRRRAMQDAVALD